MDYYTAQQAAKILSMHPETLRSWEEQGKLSFVVQKTKGGHRRYPKAGVELLKEKIAGESTESVEDVATDMQKTKVKLLEAAKRDLFALAKPVFDAYPEVFGLCLHDPDYFGDGGRVWFDQHVFELILKEDGQITYLENDYDLEDEVHAKYPLLPKTYEKAREKELQAFRYQAGKKYDFILLRDGEYIIYNYYGQPVEGADHPDYKDITALVKDSTQNWAVSQSHRYYGPDADPDIHFCRTSGIPLPTDRVISLSGLDKLDDLEEEILDDYTGEFDRDVFDGGSPQPIKSADHKAISNTPIWQELVKMRETKISEAQSSQESLSGLKGLLKTAVKTVMPSCQEYNPEHLAVITPVPHSATEAFFFSTDRETGKHTMTFKFCVMGGYGEHRIIQHKTIVDPLNRDFRALVSVIMDADLSEGKAKFSIHDLVRELQTHSFIAELGFKEDTGWDFNLDGGTFHLKNLICRGERVDVVEDAIYSY